MTKTKAAHDSGNYHAPNVHGSADGFILPSDDNRDWNVGTTAAGIIIMLAFGAMMLIGAWFGWM